jgi:hypothetical protein
MYKIDLRNQMINSGYIKLPGISLSIKKQKLSTQYEFMIITCNDMELISEYINQSEKRVYVLLDKRIKMPLEHNDNSNVWFVKSDMNLPNLISTPDTLLSITLSQYETDKTTIQNTFYFLKKQLLKYVEKYTNLEISTDFIYVENENVIKSTISDLSIADKMFPEIYDIVISDDKDLIPKYKTSRNKELRSFIEMKYDDYAWMIKDNKVKLIIGDNQDAYILTTRFDFDISKYERYDFFENMTYERLNELNAFTKELKEINFEDSVSKNVEVKADLLVKNDDEKLERLIKEEVSRINTKGIMALEVNVNVTINDLKLSDIKNNKYYKEIERDEESDDYQNLNDGERILSLKKSRILLTKKYHKKYEDMNFEHVILNK